MLLKNVVWFHTPELNHYSNIFNECLQLLKSPLASTKTTADAFSSRESNSLVKKSAKAVDTSQAYLVPFQNRKVNKY